MKNKTIKEKWEGNKELSWQIVSYIKDQREQEGLTQLEMGEKLGLDYGVYAHLESGRRELKIIELYKFCMEFDIDVRKLLADAVFEYNFFGSDTGKLSKDEELELDHEGNKGKANLYKYLEKLNNTLSEMLNEYKGKTK